MRCFLLGIVCMFLLMEANAQTKRPEFFEELQLEDTSGNIINTSALMGKLVYVDFWFTTCSPCLKEIPWSDALQQFYAKDTNIVFLNICIESLERKAAWKKMVAEKNMKGIQLFYTRNRPQKVNLLRQYDIRFPTYILVDKNMKVISYDMPRPSETGWVYWLIRQALKGATPHETATRVDEQYDEYNNFMKEVKASLPEALHQ